MSGVGTKSIFWQWCGAVVGIALLSGAMMAVAQAPAGGAGATGSSALAPLDRLICQIEREFLDKCTEPPSLPNASQINCDTLPEDVFAHFQQLERNYVKVRQVVEESNAQRIKIVNRLRSTDFTCNTRFKNDNQSQVTILKDLTVDENLESLRKISLCVRPKIEKLQGKIIEVRQPHDIERIMREIDKWRSMESDAISMTMELGYFRNKIARLVEEYEANLTNNCR